MNIIYQYTIYVKGRLSKRGKIRENLGTGTQMSYQRSWKNFRLEKRNIRENSCLRTGTLTDSKGFCENSSLGKGKPQA
jgi:hypothetical protein